MSSFDVEKSTIFVTLGGSHAHGTSRDESDIDLRGVCIAPLRVRISFLETFEQHEGHTGNELWTAMLPRVRSHPTASRSVGQKVESTLFDVAKFVMLCANANPNALEILFADEQDWLYETPAWKRLHSERRRFLSRKVQQTYLGYAMAQLRKIKTHRSWLLHPPARKPLRSDFGLPDETTLSHDDRDRIEKALAAKLRSWDIETLDMPAATRIAIRERLEAFWCDVTQTDPKHLEERLRDEAGKALGLPEALRDALDGERRYRAAVKHWNSFQRWKADRNPQRAQLEAQFGYDTKHGMHLIRLARTGLELVETGELKVRRPDAAELCAIRDGSLSYEELLAEADRLRQRMETAAPRSSLPLDVDREALDELLRTLIRDAMG